MLQLDFTNAVDQLRRLRAKKIFVQVPEGIKTNVDDIVEELESKGFETITGLDPCFGACDLKESEATKTGCDAILHLGHNRFLEKTKVPVVYAPLKYYLGKNFVEVVNDLKNYLKKNKVKVVGLTTTIQYLGYLPKIKHVLEKNKIRAFIGKGIRTEDGQVLGCNYSSAKTIAKIVVFFGDGLFHPIGINFATGKKVVAANPLTKEIKILNEDRERFLRQRTLLIEKAKEGTKFGIIVSTKLGQSKPSLARKIKELLELSGKRAKIYSMDQISKESLLGVKADVLINTACPRIAFDDFVSFKQPVLNSNELGILLGKKGYEDYFIEDVY